MKILILIIILALFYLLKYATFFIVISLVPSFAAYISDKTKAKLKFHTVLSFNIAGMLPYTIQLISDDSYVMAIKTFSSVYVWLKILGAAAVGWIVVLALPILLTSVIRARQEHKIKCLQEKQEKLVEEWGPEVQKQPTVRKNK